MHFSRNPPGPNTSCIEGFAGPLTGASAAPSGALPATDGSFSMVTYLRWAVFTVRLTFDSGTIFPVLNTGLDRSLPSIPHAEIHSVKLKKLTTLIFSILTVT